MGSWEFRGVRLSTVPLTARTTGLGDERWGDEPMDGGGIVGVAVDGGPAFVTTWTLDWVDGGTGDEFPVGDRADCCECIRWRSSGRGDVCGELRSDRSAREPVSDPRDIMVGLVAFRPLEDAAAGTVGAAGGADVRRITLAARLCVARAPWASGAVGCPDWPAGACGVAGGDSGARGLQMGPRSRTTSCHVIGSLGVVRRRTVCRRRPAGCHGGTPVLCDSTSTAFRALCSVCTRSRSPSGMLARRSSSQAPAESRRGSPAAAGPKTALRL